MKKYLLSIILWIILSLFFYYTKNWEINLILRGLWRLSFLYIALALSVTPIVKLTWNHKLFSYRRTFWVISFFMAILHAIYYFYIEYKFQNTFFILEHFKTWDIITWIIWLFIIIILWITSNNFSIKILKSNWTKIQSLTYPLFVIITLHVAFASRFDSFYIIIISLLVLTRTAAYFKKI